jgi:UDP-N-acetylmuramyl pentapeptide phosphotransferase/UDP-N-acetylglucosamine-1-phosphate transferase
MVLGDIHVTLYFVPILITIFWYVLVFNAVNFSDGVPGLAGGFSLISFIILGGLAMKLLLIDTSSAATQNSHFLLVMLAIIIPVTFFVTRLDISRR